MHKDRDRADPLLACSGAVWFAPVCCYVMEIRDFIGDFILQSHFIRDFIRKQEPPRVLGTSSRIPAKSTPGKAASRQQFQQASHPGLQ